MEQFYLEANLPCREKVKKKKKKVPNNLWKVSHSTEA